MTVKKIIYARLKNLGNYEHEELSVEVELLPGEKPKEIFKKVKKFVEKQLEVSSEEDDLDNRPGIPF